MTKYVLPLLAAMALTSNCFAQTPTSNLMPDGSQDMFVGAGVIARPLYEGSKNSKHALLPVLQIQWSNGLFVSGMSAGWHLSEQSGVEYGPLISLQPSRTPAGLSNNFGTPNYHFTGYSGSGVTGKIISKNHLDGMGDIKTGFGAGGFYNVGLSNELRLNNTFLYGAGNDGNGLSVSSDLRYSFNNIFAHHKVSLSLGLDIVNQAYNQTYFGVTEIQAKKSINPQYTPSAGIKDVHADLFWTWNLSSAWLITSRLNLTKLTGSAATSPLVEKKNQVSVSSALAYRF
jgi:outer membrane scaffolding protein for murein synthesis (MipA/OmpV family)